MYKEQIRAIYEQLSPGYRRISDFLLNRYQDAAFMTAAEIARSVQVDTALVVRFAQRLGYPGFPELINDVQLDVKRDLRAVYEPADGDDSPVEVLRRDLLQDRNNLEYALLHLDTEAVQKVIELIAGAARVLIAGEGNATFLVEAFVTRLVLLGVNAHAVSPELAGQAAIAASIRPGDVFVGVALTTLTPGVISILKGARKAGAKTIGIAGSITNPVAGTAELVVAMPARTVGTTPSWTGIASLLHGLSQAVAAQRSEPPAEWAIRTEDFLNTYADMLRDELTTIRDTIRTYR